MTIPSRIAFLTEAARIDLRTEKLDTFYAAFLEENDPEGASAAAGAGVASIWDSGREYKRYDIWYKRINELLKEKRRLSPLAAASLYGFKALVELTGFGDPEQAAKSYRSLSGQAEKAGSSSLRLFFAAAVSYSLLWQGRLSEAEIVVEDATPLFLLPETCSVSKIYYQTTLGLVRTICGKPEEGRKILEEIINLPFFAMLPPPVFYLGYGHLLHAMSSHGTEDEIDGIAEKVRERAVPEQNYFHHSYLHFNLGVAYLGAKAPHKALLHSEEAIRKGRLSQSPIAERMPALLRGQALSDLGRETEAMEHLKEWIGKWEEGGFHLVASAGSLELSHLLHKRGETEEARKSFHRAASFMPRGEALPHLFRPEEFLSNLRSALFPSAEATAVPAAENAPVKIQTFGNLTIRIGDQTLYDRGWKGRGTKNLLKALIVHGGTKVGAELLTDLLWQDCDGFRAFNNLKMTLSRLRKIGCRDGEPPLPWVVMKQRRVSLVQTLCTVDALLFEETLCRAENGKAPMDQLQEALDLCRDDFLAGDRSEIWIIRHREYLRDVYIRTVFRFVEGCMERGDPGVALPYLHNALERDPLNEEIYASLMKMNLQMGYPSKAIQLFRTAEETLKKELDIAPGPALTALARKAGMKI